MYPISIKGVLENEAGDVVLLQNERNEWELPGGRIEDGETPQECLAREIMEELGLAVSVGPLLDSYVFEVIPGQRVFIVTYGCTLAGPFAPVISDEHTRFGVFAPDSLPHPLPSGYRASIDNWTSLREGAWHPKWEQLDGVELRPGAVEQRVASVEASLQYVATKADLYQAMNARTWKMAGFGATMMAVTFAVARYL